MAVQTSYSVYHGAKYAGAVNSVNPYATASKLNTGAANIPFGYGVVSDGENGMVLPTSGSVAAEFIGIVMRELNRAYADGEVFGAPVGYDGTVVTHGRVAGVAGATVAKDEPVFLGVGSSVAGKFTNAAGTGATLAVAITGAKFLEAGGDGDAVWISLGIGG